MYETLNCGDSTTKLCKALTVASVQSVAVYPLAPLPFMFSLPSGSDYNSHSPADQSGPAPSATPSTLQPPQVRPAAGHAHYQALLWGGGRGCYRVVWLHHRTWGTPPDVLRQQRNSDNGRHSGIALTQKHTASTECSKGEVALCHTHSLPRILHIEPNLSIA